MLRGELGAAESELTTIWGTYWFHTVREMVEVELASVSIRALRQDHYDLSVRLRENVMKRLSDLRLSGYEHRTMMNVGSNHAQKDYLRGTDQEWLGDYLVHRSNVVGGPVIVVAVAPARILSETGGSVVSDDLAVSPENELRRLMNESWPNQAVFLPFEDPVFQRGGVPLNFERTVYSSAPGRHYDAFVSLPVAHRIPIR